MKMAKGQGLSQITRNSSSTVTEYHDNDEGERMKQSSWKPFKVFWDTLRGRNVFFFLGI